MDTANKIVHISEERRVTFDRRLRVVSLSLFKAMCARTSRDSRSYSIHSITRSRVWVEFRHTHYDRKAYAEFPIYYDKETKSVMVVCIVLGVTNHGPTDVQAREFDNLIDCVPLWFDPQLGKYVSTEEQILSNLSVVLSVSPSLGYIIAFGSHALARLHRTRKVYVEPELSGGYRWVLRYAGMTDESDGEVWTITNNEELSEQDWEIAKRYVAHEYAKEYDYFNHKYQYGHEDLYGCWGPLDEIL